MSDPETSPLPKVPRTAREPDWRPCGCSGCAYCTEEIELRKLWGIKTGEPYGKDGK